MPDSLTNKVPLFIPFQSPVEGIALPEKFNFPFQYEPHPISIIAARELQAHLTVQEEWDHNFGLDKEKSGMAIGKMFGVLVVRKTNGELGYLAAFSGKLAGSNHHPLFVPPVFDILDKNGFFIKGETELNAINARITELENSPGLMAAKSFLQSETENCRSETEKVKQAIKDAKEKRNVLRQQAEKKLDEPQLQQYLEVLRKESIREQYFLKDLIKQCKRRIGIAEEQFEQAESELLRLKETRKIQSALLQQKIFSEYAFLNCRGEKKSLFSVFQEDLNIQAPAGAGECAAPKLLQYAFLHHLQPIALAEFWWGRSPSSEVRKHGNFYPCCRGKCEPILNHMLKGMEVEQNPALKTKAIPDNLTVLFEDDHVLVLVKPVDLLSVPGISVKDSVLNRIQKKYPEIEGPVIVHRLDMSTSGIMVLAKTGAAYRHLQRQFAKREVKKRYLALLDGYVDQDEGRIELPLRVDLENRPRQMVCYEHGKHAITLWKVMERNEGKTRIQFFPLSGRTHQLRVHASHRDGLHVPIVGDDLYGNPAQRLYLQADRIEFLHPDSGEIMKFEIEPEF